MALLCIWKNISNDVVIDTVISKKRQMNTKTIGIDFGCVQSSLETAMRWQGHVDVASPLKIQKQMSSKIMDVHWTAQYIAKSGVHLEGLQATKK